ncbi:MAG TPA: PhnD/SsuA/transferrin family substrate-binding protein [Burkholderiales bacterium]|nr:PhnD/SsuA/transferrin family substrate-binding protein [Burkholderiales bacterium]
MALLANARMYSVTPSASAGWRTIIEWAARRAEVPVEHVEHAPPKLLSDLWSRDDLGIVQMCGLPASLRKPAPTILAAPVPSLPRYGGKAVYMSDIAVRADSRFHTLEDTFGGVAGYTLKDSQSGYFAFRTLLLTKHPQARYARIVGGLLNPRGVIKALAEGKIDVGPLDGYVFDLIRAGDPEFAAQVRVVAVTDPTPMPPLVATAALKKDETERLRSAFMAVHEEPALDPARKSLLIDRFVVPELKVYDETRRRAERVEEAAQWP